MLVSKIHTLNPNTQSDGKEVEAWKVWVGHRGRVLPNEISVLRKALLRVLAWSGGDGARL